MTISIQRDSVDPGLYVLVSLLRMNGIGADAEQIRHRFGAAPIGIPEMLRCAKEFGLKARERRQLGAARRPRRCRRSRRCRDGGFLLLGKVADGKVLVQRRSRRARADDARPNSRRSGTAASC